MYQIKKMTMLNSIAFFGIAGLWIYLNFAFTIPMLLGINVPLLYAALLSMSVPIISLVVYIYIQLKKSELKPSEFLFMKKLSRKEISISIGLFFVVQGLELFTSPSRIWLSQYSFFKAPDYYPDLFLPEYTPSLGIKTFMGVQLSDNYIILIIWALWLVVNILGEEILWRGYALKRMELYFGKWAWLINGILWNVIVHFFIRWTYISILPVSLVVPFVCQKTKSFWPGVIIHGIGNLLVYVVIIPGIFS